MEPVLNLIFPPKCVRCGNVGEFLCPNCLRRCLILDNNRFGLRGLKVFSCFEYEGLARKIIRMSKYSSRQFAALKILTEYGMLFARNYGLAYKGFYVTSIPLSTHKYKKRGFNQAEIIAKTLAATFNLKYVGSILNRHKETRSQFHLPREERLKNIKNAFSCDKNLKERKILIVDDICTSGATLLESARALHQAGAAEIQAFTLCKKSLRNRG